MTNTKQTRLMLILMSGILLSSAPVVFGESKIKGTISNTTTIKNSTNKAGKGAEANMGSVVLDNVNQSGTIINKQEISGVKNIAVGSGSEANYGSVVIKNKNVSGKIINIGGEDKDKTNIAVGGQTSNKNSIIIK